MLDSRRVLAPAPKKVLGSDIKTHLHTPKAATYHEQSHYCRCMIGHSLGRIKSRCGAIFILYNCVGLAQHNVEKGARDTRSIYLIPYKTYGARPKSLCVRLAKLWLQCRRGRGGRRGGLLSIISHHHITFSQNGYLINGTWPEVFYF